jgi:hypothetical protein
MAEPVGGGGSPVASANRAFDDAPIDQKRQPSAT